MLGSGPLIDNDNPIENATVYAAEVGTSSTPATASTDANGGATITGLDAADYRTWAEKDLGSDGSTEVAQVQILTAS